MFQLEIIKDAIKKLCAELSTKNNIKSIGLFGAVVRDDFSPPNSDVDIIVDFSGTIGIEFINLAKRLVKKIQRKIDLVSNTGIKKIIPKKLNTK